MIVTIIVLLILAGVTLNLIAGEDGILGRAENSVSEHKIGAARELLELKLAEIDIDSYEIKHRKATFAEIVDKLKNDPDFIIVKTQSTSVASLSTEAESSWPSDPADIEKIWVCSVEYKDIIFVIPSDGEIELSEDDIAVEVPDEEEEPEPDPEPEQYTITYNANGGTGDIPEEQTVVSGGTVTVNFSTIPSKEGYTFAGWSDGVTTYEQGSQESFSMPNNDVTLYAQWVGNSYSINYYNGTTKLGSSNHSYGTENALTTIATLGGTQSGYTFAGWSTSGDATSATYTDGQNVNNLTNVSGESIDFYAIWQRTATFYSGTSNSSTATATQYYNPKGVKYVVATPSITAISGWTTVGWRADTTAGDKEISEESSISSSSQKFYAVYSRTATFYSGISKASSTTRTQYYNSNGAYAVVAPPASEITAISGWTTIGWYEFVSGHDFSVNETITKTAQVYYGRYSREVELQYDANGGTGTMESYKMTQYYSSYPTTSAKNITLPENTFTRDGYTFKRWGITSDAGGGYAEGETYNLSPSVSKSPIVTLYAVWQTE